MLRGSPLRRGAAWWRRASAFGLVFVLLAGSSRAATRGPAPAATEVIEVAVRPSRTDPAIRTFDEPHLVFVPRGLVAERAAGLPAPRGELLLFLPGTSPAPAPGSPARGGRPGAAEFCRLAANLGYHVIFLRYPNAQSASACARDEDAGEFERFRLAIIRGGASRHITVPREESIEHRLIRLLAHLQRARPREEWARYLTVDGAIRWERMAVAGQSQGGGHAVLIGLRHRVARVIATGAPKDFSVRHARPAPWLGVAESATPRGRFFTFNHLQDRQAATHAQQLQNLHALGLDAFGPPVNVDAALPPYGGTRILVTDFPGGTTLPSREAHTAVISGRNAARFEPVWRHLLTAPVE